MSKKNSLIICMVAALSLFVEMGCATKKYVKLTPGKNGARTSTS